MPPDPISASDATLLRPATIEDRPFIDRLVEITESMMAARTRGWDEDAVRARIDRTLASTETDIIVRGGAEIGARALETNGGRVVLHLLRLLPVWQRQGLGSAILSEMAAAADAAGRSIEATLAKVDPAHAFYVRFGFVPVSETLLTVTLVRPPGGAARGGVL